MPMWRSAAECSTVSQQRPEKLDRRWFKDGCVGQQAMMSMQSGDADEPRLQMTDGGNGDMPLLFWNTKDSLCCVAPIFWA